MEEVVIIDALRTPIGKFHGQFDEVSAVTLGSELVKALLNRNKKMKKSVDQVIFGNVLQAGNGQNPARQIALKSGLSEEVPAFTVNEVCGSGMKAVALARQAICLGESEVVIAGGVESMSQAPYLSQYDKKNDSYSQPVPVMLKDGLTDAFSGKHMGLTAENVAEKYKISRQEQDVFSLQSQLKAIKALKNGYFDQEIWPIRVHDQEIETDEGIRFDTSLEKLAKLKAAFKKEGTVTAGNASTINDGASVLIIASKSFAQVHGLSYLAVIKDITEVAIEPSLMGISPIKAINQLLQRNEMTIKDIDLFEINEAFAATSLVVERQLGIPPEKINLAGGGISIGHAIGATGARIMTTAVYQLKRIKKKYAVASLCVGGGLGLAVLLENPTFKKENKKFYDLTQTQRLEYLEKHNSMSATSKLEFQKMTLPKEVADHLIENLISEVEIPLGVVLNLQVNGKKYQVPMATEEPSVVAACNNGVKMANLGTGFKSEMVKKVMRGQIVFYNVKEQQKLIRTIQEKREEIFETAKQSYPSIEKRGGGLRDISIRQFPEASTFVSLDLLVDTKDAMGANIVNTILEDVAEKLKEWTSEKILFGILSNYNTESLVTVSCEVPFSALSKEHGEKIAEKIGLASDFAQLDPIRAATHNKGIMNGIEAVVLATGNDTRALSACVHAYASKDGNYQGLSQWQMTSSGLKGTMSVPLVLATFGGATRVLPKAKAAFELLGIEDAKVLAEVAAAIGLAQNLAALKALVTDGIQKGHMSLQARSLAMSQGAIGKEIEVVAEKLQEGSMNSENAKVILDRIRSEK